MLFEFYGKYYTENRGLFRSDFRFGFIIYFRNNQV